MRTGLDVAYDIPLANVASPTISRPSLATPLPTARPAPFIWAPRRRRLRHDRSSSLESSTVDLATELTEMVQAQSSYEANSKVFQTGRQHLDVLNGLKP